MCPLFCPLNLSSPADAPFIPAGVVFGEGQSYKGSQEEWKGWVPGPINHFWSPPSAATIAGDFSGQNFTPKTLRKKSPRSWHLCPLNSIKFGIRERVGYRSEHQMGQNLTHLLNSSPEQDNSPRNWQLESWGRLHILSREGAGSDCPRGSQRRVRRKTKIFFFSLSSQRSLW